MTLKQILNSGKVAGPLLAVCLLLGSVSASSASQDIAQKMVEDAIDVESASQKVQTQWTSERSAMVNEIRQLKNENLWLSFQEKKYSRYVLSLDEKITELERIKTEMERMEQELEPLLYDLVARIGNEVQTDLPFLTTERTRRLNFLHRTLDDHTIPNGEKLRRILEALEVETAYGQSADSTEQTIILDGKPTQVTILRAGRLGLYCLTPDQETAGQYQPKAGGYTTLPSKFTRPLVQLETMIERKRFTDFVFLPMKEVR
nr:DUF3450 domain-containing protein [uncultured Pseudodesulfovibrio sp.]